MSRLSEYPYVIVRIACSRCPRKGQYRLVRLAERYGAEARLTDVLAKLSANCPHADTALHQGVHDRCGAIYPDLTKPTPPDVPPAALGCGWSVAELPNKMRSSSAEANPCADASPRTTPGPRSTPS